MRRIPLHIFNEAFLYTPYIENSKVQSTFERTNLYLNVCVRIHLNINFRAVKFGVESLPIVILIKVIMEKLILPGKSSRSIDTSSPEKTISRSTMDAPSSSSKYNVY